MKKYFALLPIIWFFVFSGPEKGFAQGGCQINLGILTPNVCVGSQVCIPFTLTNCTGSGQISLELSGPLPSAASACTFNNIVLSTTGACLTVPQNFQQGTYCVRLKRGSIVSEAKRFFIDTIDRSPAPQIQIVQLPPIRPSYCKDDTVRFKVLNITNAGQGFSLQWTKNDTAKAGDTSSFFTVTNLVDGDFISAFVTRQNKCALNATGKSDSIVIPVGKPPVVEVNLRPGSSGCENEINSFVANLQTAGPDPMVYWIRSNVRRTDTLSQGINDTLFTLSPADSAQFGDSIIAYVVAGRCKLTDKNFFLIRACGEVSVIDSLLDSVACAGTPFSVPYDVLGSFVQGNLFTVQLSDSSGSFANPLQIGSLAAFRPDTISTVLPANLPGGNCYRVRIIASTPADTSENSSCFKIFPRPEKPLTQNDSVCGTGEVTLTASSAQSGMTFNWYADPFSDRLLFTGAVRTLTISGDSVYYVAAVSPKGCESERSEVRAISKDSTPVDVGPDRSVCVGSQTIQLNPSIAGGTWSGDLAVIGNQIDLTGISFGLYKLNYKTVNALGCFASDSLLVTVKALPQAFAGPDTSVCGNGIVFVLPGAPSGGIWLGSSILSDGTYDPSQAGAGLDTLIYKVNQNGCDGFDTLVVTVQPAPGQFSVSTVNPSSCAVDDGTATITGVTLLPSWKVRWSVNTADSTAFPTLGGLGGGAYSVQITDTLSIGSCSREINFALSDPNVQDPVISGLDSNYCNNDSCVTITVSPTSPSGFWTGDGVSGIQEGVAQFCPGLAKPGSSSISYQYDNSSGCVGATAVNIQINQAPVVNAGVFNDTLCSDADPVQLTGFSPTTAIWGPQPLVSPTGLFNPSSAASGNNELTLTLNASNGCSRTATRNMKVAPAPVPVITRSPVNQVCQGQEVTLSVNPGSGVTVRRIEWQRNGQVIAGQNASQLIATQAGSYKAIVTGAGECGGESAEVVVSFVSLPPDSVTVNGALNPCSNNLSTLTAASGTGFTYQWFLGPDSITAATSSSLTPNQSGQYRVRVRNASGCEVFSAITNLSIREAPVAQILAPLGDTCLQAGQPISISSGASGDGLTFQWFLQGSPNTLLVGQTASAISGITTPGRYFVVATSSNGCSDNSDTVQILNTTQISILDTVIFKCLGDSPFQVTGFSPGNCPLLFNGTVLANNSWNPNQVGDFILTYQCTNANGCISRKNITIRVSQPPESNLLVIGPTSVCQGDSVRLQVNNGTETGRTYQLYRNGNPYRQPFLQPFIYVNEAGSYRVEVNFNRCFTLSNAVNITIRPIPLATAGAALSVCGTLNTNLNNQPGVTPGTWSGSPRVVTGGQYNSDTFTGCDTLTLTVTQNGCSASATKEICIKPLPGLQADALDASGCTAQDGKAWIVNAPVSGFGYVWRKAGNTAVLSETDSLLNAAGGAYLVTITDSNTNCTVTRNLQINTPNNLNVEISGLPASACFGSGVIQLTGILAGQPSDSGTFSSFANRIIDGNVYDPSISGALIDTVYFTGKLGGCVATVSQVIRLDRPVADAGTDKSVCFGDTLVLKAQQPANVPLQWQGPQISSDSLFVANNSAITTALVRFTYSVNGCEASDSLLVTVRPLPDYSVTPQNVTSCGSCDGGAIREMSNSSQFQTIWRQTPANNIIGTGASISNRCVGTYSAQVINNSTGCSLIKTFGITGPTNLDPLNCLLNVPEEVCQGSVPILLQKCDTLANILIAGVDTDTLKPSSFIPGEVQVQLTLTDQNGCQGVQQKTVQVRALPVVSLNGTTPGFACTEDATVQLANFFPPFDGSNPLNGWAATGVPANFINPSGQINPALISNDALIPLTYTVNSAGTLGCSTSKNFQFRVYKNPVASIIPTASLINICQGQDTLLVAQPLNPSFSYKWLYGTGSVLLPFAFSDSLMASLQGKYELEISNNGCKSARPSVVLTVSNAPVIASVGSDITVCKSGGNFILPNPTVTGVGPFTSGWQPSAGTPAAFITSSGLVRPDSVPVGTYQVKFVASQGACSDDATLNITVLRNRISTIAGSVNQEICAGEKAVLRADTTGPGLTYIWYRNGIGIPGQNADTLLADSSGRYRVQVIQNGSANCSSLSTDSVVLQVKPAPVVVIQGNLEKSICFPGPPFIIADNGNPFQPLDAVWSSSVPGVVTPGGFVRPDSIPNQGTINLVLTKTIGNCTSRDTLKLNAFKSPNADFQSTQGAICTGELLTLNYANPDNFNTVWLGVLAANPNDTAILAVNVDSLNVTQQGTYILRVNNDLCRASKSASYEVKPKPVFGLPSDTVVCKNATVLQFFPKAPSEGIGTWSGPGISPTGSWNPGDPAVPEFGPVALTYTLSSEGCSTTKFFTIDVGSVPIVSLTASDDTAEVLQAVELRASGGVAFSWSPAIGLSSTSGPVVTARIDQNQTYTVQVTSAKGCKAEKSIDLIVDKEFKVYNAFSPQSSKGKNDLWEIKNIKLYPEARVRIYNRWGNLVFESEAGYPKPWDGTFEGNPLPPGAYYYIIERGAGLTPESGSITLVR